MKRTEWALPYLANAWLHVIDCAIRKCYESLANTSLIFKRRVDQEIDIRSEPRITASDDRKASDHHIPGSMPVQLVAKGDQILLFGRPCTQRFRLLMIIFSIHSSASSKVLKR